MIRVDYAGPGGVCWALECLGLDHYGIEWDEAACATRAAAGLPTIRADLTTYRPLGEITGYWGSPPCQTFSMEGGGSGRKLMPMLAEAIYYEDWGRADDFDYRTRHVIDSSRVAVESGAEWVAMEQVPPALPAWEALVAVLGRHGYSAWCGVLNATDYGVPQTRKRAFLMASRVKEVQPPPPTHTKDPGVAPLFEEPLPRWVSMAEALGWSWGRPSPTGPGVLNPGATGGNRAPRNKRLYSEDEPAPTLAFGKDYNNWQWEMPATTLCGDSMMDGATKLTVQEALVLQSFPSDYPVQGSKHKKFEQVGNAVPPLMAEAIIRQLAF